MNITELFKQRPNVENYDFKVFGYIADLTKFIEKIEKKLILHSVVSCYFSDYKEALSYLKGCAVFKDEIEGASEQLVINLANSWKTAKMLEK